MDKRFIQLLEGEPAALEQAYARIRQDPRHQHLCQVAHHPIAARNFASWLLAFQSLSSAQSAHLVPTKSGSHVRGYGPFATSFAEAIRALMQPSTAIDVQSL
jgi:hypothetical protein